MLSQSYLANKSAKELQQQRTMARRGITTITTTTTAKFVILDADIIVTIMF
jgi:hypothetical protein